MKPKVIHVQVSGPVGVGKTGALFIIRNALESAGYTCASPELDADIRMVGRAGLVMPSASSTVIVIGEDVA